MAISITPSFGPTWDLAVVERHKENWPAKLILILAHLRRLRKSSLPNQPQSKVFQTAFCSLFFIHIFFSGSGWGWLGWNKAAAKLQVATCQNQDPLEATTGLIPLLGIDVWEHAYYIQYKNLRAAYVDKIFDVFNWNNVAERFANARK